MLIAFCIQREVDHHNRIFLHDANQQQDSDQRNHAQVGLEKQQGQHRADACGRKCRKNCDRMDETLIKNTQHNINSRQRCDNQEWRARQR